MKKRTIQTLACLTTFIPILLAGIYLANYETFDLKFKNNVLEYGEKVDFNKLLVNNDLKIVKSDYKEKNPKNLGEHTINFDVKLDDKVVKRKHVFQIIDTTAPTIEIKEEKVVVNQGDSFDVKTNIVSCKDTLDGNTEYTVEGKVDTSKVGQTNIKIHTKDKHQNASSKEFTVEVREKKENDKGEARGETQQVANNYTQPTVPQKTHWINRNAITGFVPSSPDVYKYLDAIVNGQHTFTTTDTGYFSEILYDLYEISDIDSHTLDVSFKPDDTVAGQYVVTIDGEGFGLFQQKLVSGLPRDARYKDYIVNVLSGMNLNTSDYNLVRQIQNFMCANFSYQITNGLYDSMVNTGVGQCTHYAHLFEDMCNAVGIPCEYVTNENHAWNRVLVDGTWYYADVTWLDSTGDIQYALSTTPFV